MAAHWAPRDRLLFLQTRGGPNGFAEAGRLLNTATGDEGFAVERFHLRRRGALVMVLRHPSGQRRVVRIATNPRVAALARWNQEITRDLRGQATLAPEARQLIPEPLGVASNGTVEGFAESFHPGRLAWLLYRNDECRSRIDQDLFRFSHALQSTTCRQTRLDGEALAGLLARYLGPVEQRLGNRPGLGGRLGAIRTRLRQLLGGRVFPLCAAHGDYGVGNALATPEGNLTAIIDWDQFQPADPAGVDWCDYRIKAEHFRRPVLDRLPAMIAEASRHGGLAAPHSGFGAADFDLGPAATWPSFRAWPCSVRWRVPPVSPASWPGLRPITRLCWIWWADSCRNRLEMSRSPGVLIIDQGASFGGSVLVAAVVANRMPVDRYRVHLAASVDPSVLRVDPAAAPRITYLVKSYDYVAQARTRERFASLPRVIRRIGGWSDTTLRMVRNNGYTRQLAALIREHDIRLVHLNNGFENLEAHLAAALTRRPVVVHAHGPCGDSFISRRLAPNVPACIGISGP